MTIRARLAIIIIFFFCVVSCHNKPTGQLVISDFESEDELDRVQWQCHTLCSLSDENATHGNKSLRLELYPADYPGIAFQLPTHNWSRYESLSLDIFNPANESLSITMRIDDAKDYPDYEDRYNQSFPIQPGLNHLRIPLASMITSGTKRSINLNNIQRCLIFMVQPHKKRILYIDHVHLA